mmetsp:Transcript_26456/g.76343  ORF Transcript_26456/g.76343 Transcript_26456/m.76343 type:complete len:212 (-) Transcript_26456:4338-4973(-)
MGSRSARIAGPCRPRSARIPPTRSSRCRWRRSMSSPTPPSGSNCSRPWTLNRLATTVAALVVDMIAMRPIWRGLLKIAMTMTTTTTTIIWMWMAMAMLPSPVSLMMKLRRPRTMTTMPSVGTRSATPASRSWAMLRPTRATNAQPTSISILWRSRRRPGSRGSFSPACAPWSLAVPTATRPMAASPDMACTSCATWPSHPPASALPWCWEP